MRIWAWGGEIRANGGNASCERPYRGAVSTLSCLPICSTTDSPRYRETFDCSSDATRQMPGVACTVGCLLDVCWMSVGCLLDVCWMSVGCLLDVCWMSVGCLLDVCWRMNGLRWSPHPRGLLLAFALCVLSVCVCVCACLPRNACHECKTLSAEVKPLYY